MAKERHTRHKPSKVPAQQQADQPGHEAEMDPKPEYIRPGSRGGDRLKGKVALITGGDSGIGRAAAVAFAQEGADVAIVYKEGESDDAEETQRAVQAAGQSCLLIVGDVGDELTCRDAVEQTVSELGRLDVLINNAAEQHPKVTIEQISSRQLEATFRTNIFSMFYFAKAALPHLMKSEGASIINTTSVTAYRGSASLLDYSATKGAIVAFTRSLSAQLAEKKIRVNAVAPGPIWTPLIPATFPPERVASFGQNVPLGRPGQPWEWADVCVLGVRRGQLHDRAGAAPNGGEVING